MYPHVCYVLCNANKSLTLATMEPQYWQIPKIIFFIRNFDEIYNAFGRLVVALLKKKSIYTVGNLLFITGIFLKMRIHLDCSKKSIIIF